MRIALGIEYDGRNYSGWQRQQNARSVQEILEESLSIVADHTVEVQCAGRTDTGVHATGQVVHFDTVAHRKISAWIMGTNVHMSRDVAVRWAREVPDDFHARFTAISRRYRYIIYNNAFRPGLLSLSVSHYHGNFDTKKMHQAGQYLLGENDFSSFRAVHCQSHSSWRNVMHLSVTRHGCYIVIDIRANAFLYRMIRNIIGSLILVGQGEKHPLWIKWLLGKKDRRLAGKTAKAEGLYLVNVDYPSKFALPKFPIGPLFFSDELS
ncbi:tRNA pseudouridine(38-40) synthase TruA [Candidatus Photodesmus blepharus]|nr:tRNA pseudouridine(38-40) synthase TruA [Candidatus Photodesmus blepharus]